MRAALPTAVLLALPLAACGPTSKHGVDGGGGDAPPASGCLPGNGWVTEAVTNTPGNGTNEGHIAFTASGDMWIAFADPMTDVSSDQDVFTTHLVNCMWSSPEVRHMPSTYQWTYPSMIATGETLHLVMNGLFDQTTQNNDIYYAKREGGTWTQAAAITHEPAGMGIGAYHPVIAASATGELSIAYLFGGGATSIDTEVHVAKLVNGALQGDVVAIPGKPGGCDGPQIVYAANGTRHVVATCGSIDDARVYYTNDSGASFAAATTVDTTTGMFNMGASLALDPFGTAVHMAWRRDLPCGTGTCGEILYAKHVGAAWSTPKSVNNNSPMSENWPTMTVAPDGTIYIAYERDNAQSKTDIFVSTSSDGLSFTEAAVTPGTDTTSETMPASMVLDPTTHQPHFTFVKVIGGDPFDMEVWRATLAMGGTTGTM